MLIRLLWILLSLMPLIAGGQSVVLEVEYQPNTTYEWSRMYSYSNSVEFLGAEDKGDLLQDIGWEPYSENQNYQFIQATMKTGMDGEKKLPFSSRIDSLERNFISTRTDAWTPPEKLEIHDLQINGVINKFQKLEIDSIIGVDSLQEKNRVFSLLDDIHRSWSYSKDTLVQGVPFIKTDSYSEYYSSATASSLSKTYTLESVEDNIANIRVDYVITTEQETETGDLLDERIFEGSGSGLLMYDLKHKQVVLYEYTINEKSWNEVMDMSVETTSTSKFRRTMHIKQKD